MSVVLEWNDAGLQKIFKSLHPKVQQTYHKKAMFATANKLKQIVKEDAASAGFARGGVRSKNGWSWLSHGRVSKSVTVGKLVNRGSTVSTIRVYNRSGKRVSFSESAPHAHLVILGHEKWMPRRDGRVDHVGFKEGVPIYQAAFNNAIVIFERELEKSVAEMVAKLNRDGEL